MKLVTSIVIKPAIIGTTERLIASKGLTPAISLHAITTAAIGDMDRPIPATRLSGTIILLIVVIPNLAPISGTSFIIERNAAFPEPSKTARNAMTKAIRIVIATPPKPIIVEAFTSISTAPMAIRPSAKKAGTNNQ